MALRSRYMYEDTCSPYAAVRIKLEQQAMSLLQSSSVPHGAVATTTPSTRIGPTDGFTGLHALRVSAGSRFPFPQSSGVGAVWQGE